ncbi:MAG: ComF family protein, partial [Actinomycetota bacterium]
MLFETRCAGCDRPGAVICTTCRFALVGSMPPSSAAGVIAAVAFAGRPRDVLLGMKYRNRRAVG